MMSTNHQLDTSQVIYYAVQAFLKSDTLSTTDFSPSLIPHHNVKSLRIACNFPVSALAARLGVSKSALQAFESGTNTDYRIPIRLADYLHIPYDYMFKHQITANDTALFKTYHRAQTETREYEQDLYKILAYNLFKLRTVNHLTLKECGQLIGYDETHILYMELRKKIHYPHIVIAMSDVFGIPLQTLFHPLKNADIPTTPWLYVSTTELPIHNRKEWYYVYDIIRQNIFALVRSSNVSLGIFSRLCGLDHSSLYRIRNRKYQTISFRTVYRIAFFMHVPLVSLLRRH